MRIKIDYDDLWRGHEKDLLEAVKNTVESPVTFLTSEQKTLLERSPREFLALHPRPESVELISYQSEQIGGSERIVELTLAAAPASPAHVRFIAVVPNLVQIERQQDALDIVEGAADDGPLGPLRALAGLCDMSRLQSLTSAAPLVAPEPPGPGDRLDVYQAECVAKAMSTPHFAVIQGPPGSGKTTVITSVIRRTVARGDRVLVVSPTHVAVDNVVEKLVPKPEDEPKDRLEPHTMPVRYSARKNKLSDRAMEYWVGSKRQLRGATISRRLQQRLTAHLPVAESLYAKEDSNAQGSAALSASIAAVQRVICGTPIGILSYATVKDASPGTFDLLIVDEVSKMTLSEFLAIAVKAKRWILVGDPQQLPPYNNSEENGPTLDDVIAAPLELVCSVGAFIERTRLRDRHAARLVVVASNPARTVEAIRAHVAEVQLRDCPPIATVDDTSGVGVVVCGPDSVTHASQALSNSRYSDRTHNPDLKDSLPLLVECGLNVSRPTYASGMRFVDLRDRAHAQIFETSFNVYHARPWSHRAGQALRVVQYRRGMRNYMPSAGALAALDGDAGRPRGTAARDALHKSIATRYAINAVSVYDWLLGMPKEYFDVPPLQELSQLSLPDIHDAVRPYAGVLKKQYRMHHSLSCVPRKLFYFDEALHDGEQKGPSECRVNLVQVSDGPHADGEANRHECDKISGFLELMNGEVSTQERNPEIMIITPYRDQKAMLADVVQELRDRGQIDRLAVDVYTLDSCQGREAEYVFISLVRSRATPFLDAPKRWNVALTRAKLGLFIVGNIDAYLCEAKNAREQARNQQLRDGRPARPMMSVLARSLDEYDRQIAEFRRSQA